MIESTSWRFELKLRIAKRSLRPVYARDSRCQRQRHGQESPRRPGLRFTNDGRITHPDLREDPGIEDAFGVAALDPPQQCQRRQGDQSPADDLEDDEFHAGSRRIFSIALPLASSSINLSR